MSKKKQNILVFCSHSDDEIFGVGASLAKYAKQGKSIYTIIFSYGAASLPWLKKEVAIKTRIKEAKKADKIIGGKKVVFFNLREGKFLEEAEKKNIKEKVIGIIKTKKPIKIFTHSPDDPHPDHRAVYNIIMDVLDRINYKGDVFVFDIWNPFTIRRTYLPRLYEDITETFGIKIRALTCFKSQQIALFTLFWSVYVRALIHGSHIHTRYAERFFKVR